MNFVTASGMGGVGFWVIYIAVSYTHLPHREFREPEEPGSGLFRRRAADELGSGQEAGVIRPFQGERI